MGAIAACVIAVVGAAAKADGDKKAANNASNQALATHNSNQAAMIAKCYSQSIRATTTAPNLIDMMRAGGMTEGAGAGGGMGGGGLGNRAVTGGQQQGPGY